MLIVDFPSRFGTNLHRIGRTVMRGGRDHLPMARRSRARELGVVAVDMLTGTARCPLQSFFMKQMLKLVVKSL
jgi:hypothetical protein